MKLMKVHGSIEKFSELNLQEITYNCQLDINPLLAIVVYGLAKV